MAPAIKLCASLPGNTSTVYKSTARGEVDKVAKLNSLAAWAHGQKLILNVSAQHESGIVESFGRVGLYPGFRAE